MKRKRKRQSKMINGLREVHSVHTEKKADVWGKNDT